MRGCTVTPPPSAATRAMFASDIVSHRSKHQRNPANGVSRFTASNTSRKRPIDSS